MQAPRKPSYKFYILITLLVLNLSALFLLLHRGGSATTSNTRSSMSTHRVTIKAPIAWHTLPDEPCTANGWLANGVRPLDVFQTRPVAPSVADVFEDDGVLVAVLNLKSLDRSGSLWAWAQWSCVFPVAGGLYIETKNIEQRYDEDRESAVVRCPIPTSPAVSSHRVGLRVHGWLGLIHHEYNAIPYCSLPPKPAKTTTMAQQMRMEVCTQVLANTDPKLILEWTAWNLLQGFSSVTLYLDDYGTSDSATRAALKTAEDLGVIRLVDWRHRGLRVRNFEHQTTQVISCTLRARGRAEWLFLSDIDEFIFPTSLYSASTSTTAPLTMDWLLSHPLPDDVVGWTIPGRFFMLNQTSHSPQYDAPEALRLTATETDSKVWAKKRQKSLLRPNMVTYPNVHRPGDFPWVKVWSAPVEDIFFAHYKERPASELPRENSDHFTAIAPYRHEVFALLTQLSNH